MCKSMIDGIMINKVPAMVAENNNPEITEFVKILFGHIEDQIRLADTKAQSVLTLITSVIIAIAIAGALNKGSAISLIDIQASLLARTVALLNVFMFLILLIAVYYAILTMRPRLTSSQQGTLLYFGTISCLSQEDFTRQFLSQTSRDALMSLLETIHTKSQIALWKFGRLRLSLNFMLVSLILWASVQLSSAIIHEQKPGL